MNELPMLISFSGGRTSAFMTYYLLKKGIDTEYHIVFANTGKEREETLEFINECDKRWNLNVVWIEADVNMEYGKGTSFKIVNYENASRNGEPFENVIRKYGITNKMFPHCTRELKLVPMQKYMRSLNHKKYITAIGIRYDELNRVNFQKIENDNYYYPLATEFSIDNLFIRNWWSRQEFDLKLKDYQGNCDLCWKKSERKLMTIIKESPEKIGWWDNMEKKYGGIENYVFFRANKSAQDLVNLSKQPFRKADDLHDIYKANINMFEDIDIEFACLCKSS